jgi:hypothetical protein
MPLVTMRCGCWHWRRKREKKMKEMPEAALLAEEADQRGQQLSMTRMNR